MRRLRSNKERKRKVKKFGGGFDDSYYDERTKKLLERTYDTCYWCRQQLHPIDLINSEGKIVMSCNSPGCPGNYALNKNQWDRKYRNKFGRLLDKKLCHDFRKMAFGRHPDRLWAPRTRLV